MPWFSKSGPWQMVRESLTKTSSDERVDSKRPSSERSREQIDDQDRSMSRTVHGKFAKLSTWREKWKNAKHPRSATSEHEDFRDSTAHRLSLRPRMTRTRTSRGRASESTKQPSPNISTDTNGLSRAPIYRQPKNAAIAFLRTTRRPSDKSSPLGRQSPRLHANKRKPASIVMASEPRLSQVREESESQEASRSRSRR
ncbi:MAG: hypothetical protein M1821_002945 [Bathelium mastoideum]|nr:MAG: hypothetical protein M1821_002945 [Bathelium mastoideum]KAI9694413.1 MAG: hypothetical protein M1822_000029 [Bathelium mastoideum]